MDTADAGRRGGVRTGKWLFAGLLLAAGIGIWVNVPWLRDHQYYSLVQSNAALHPYRRSSLQLQDGDEEDEATGLFGTGELEIVKPATRSQNAKYPGTSCDEVIANLQSLQHDSLLGISEDGVYNPVERMESSERARLRAEMLQSAESPHPRPTPATTISKTIANSVKKLLLFIGYPRSCHSLVGALLDAHPNMVVSNEYDLIRHWSVWTPAQKRNRSFLYNTIYEVTKQQSRKGSRSSVPGEGARHRGRIRKEYSYKVPGQWQGNFNETISILGDKHGGRIAKELKGLSRRFYDASKESPLEDISHSLNMPLVFIHVMRHPLDIIATSLLRNLKILRMKDGNKVFSNTTDKIKVHRDYVLMQIDIFAQMADSVQQVRRKFKTIDVRCEDMIANPRTELNKLCEALEIPCSAEYLDACTGIVSDTPSRTREKIEWNKEALYYLRCKLALFKFLTESYKI